MRLPYGHLVRIPNEQSNHFYKSCFGQLLITLKKTLKDNPDVKFWFVLGPEYSKMPGISKSEPRLDPAFLDVSEKNLKSPTNKTVTSYNQSKKSISPHEGVIEYECRPVNSIPNKLYNHSNPMTLNLPTKEGLYFKI